jgi:hypothetical protein
MNTENLNELVLQALETELGGVQVYAKALECVQNEDLKKEWTKYHEQTQEHVEVVKRLCAALEIDPEEETPTRAIVRAKGKALVQAMDAALKEKPEAAELVAAECVVDAETKDHQNWELLGEAAKKAKGAMKKALEEAHDAVEEEEDEHLYHTQGWARELWLETLGMPAVLPPPEEEKHVKTQIGAARAKQAREDML